MKDIKDALQLVDLKEIQQEINERRELIRQMVGSLYPSIIYDEIFKLNYRYSEIKNVKS